MKITIEQVLEDAETEVVIRCHEIDESVRQILYMLKSPERQLLGAVDRELHLLEPEKVFYVESVDDKIFIYGEQQVYESKKKLYELEAELTNYHFFRASKSLILNIKKIKSVHPLFDGRIEALLTNNEKVFISRKYVAVLKKKLGI